MNALQNNQASSTEIQLSPLRITHLSESSKEIGPEVNWTKIFNHQPFLQLLRPDFYVIYRFDPFEIIYQENIRLDLGVIHVSHHLISKFLNPADNAHIRKVDSVISQFGRECRINPFDFICRMMIRMDCPNLSMQRMMRTTFIAQNDAKGKPEFGVICYHDISVLVGSIRPNNFDITFTPDKTDLCHEIYRRIRNVIPRTSPVTKRECEILQCLNEGLSSKETGSRLFISKATVDTHRQNMLHKWNLPNTAALLRIAKEENWI